MFTAFLITFVNNFCRTLRKKLKSQRGRGARSAPGGGGGAEGGRGGGRAEGAPSPTPSLGAQWSWRGAKRPPAERSAVPYSFHRCAVELEGREAPPSGTERRPLSTSVGAQWSWRGAKRPPAERSAVP